MTAVDNTQGRPRDPEVTRRITEAALLEYSRTGWAAFTMDGVARRAGVGKAALYRRWKSKEGLLVDALEARSQPVTETVDQGDFRSDTIALAAELMCHFLDPAGWATLRIAVDAADNTAPLAQFYERIVLAHREAVARFFERNVARGALSPGASAAALAECLFGAVFMHVLAMAPADRTAARDSAIEHVTPLVDLLLNGVSTEHARD
ncbi:MULTISPECIES: TetR/AcrR family transcriptional regulator [Gordonia]|uniref:TetR/AcrR family transcriptional regulator n=3 Tax=Gordonia TaxID=2053 RepID=A0AAW6RCF4_GORRU|nr:MULTISPECIES: TetR/AcrR family transcriptional regulator [Gordonia]ASR03085.1 DNA-binding transcriptional repressor AcrR [Gordonia rubripertincta]AZG45415.1 putative HTH-type transcriptional regulator [Gordonia insulae]MDG6782131.1 TetR/AcrR family transcriptional regulator [Gordonia rubripertincta]NKY64692.1 TetR/AcrR family transcriptional regulator [Gordonia rubripertincta]GAB86278.1 putative TetR family transcriptional regulator [Gordonia rubripertincta NBRC 101908]